MRARTTIIRIMITAVPPSPPTLISSTLSAIRCNCSSVSVERRDCTSMGLNPLDELVRNHFHFEEGPDAL